MPCVPALLCVCLIAACSQEEAVMQADVAPPAVIQKANPAKDGIPWYAGSVDEAFAYASKEGKPVLLYWGAEWCPPCHQLKATIFKRDEFVEQSKLFIPVYLDGDTERAQQYGEKFGVRGYPTVIIFRADGVEITRIPGGMDIEQYLGVLELALNAIRPVKELLLAVDSDDDLRDDSWKLLANYSWSQDRGRALGERNEQALFRKLAEACPQHLAVDRSKLQLLAFEAWAGDEQRDETLAGDYLATIVHILNDAELSRENLGTLVYIAGDMVAMPMSDESRLALTTELTGLFSAALEDQSLDVLTRIRAVNGWLKATTALLPEGETPSVAEQAWVKAQLVKANSGVNPYQLQPAINATWQIYLDAGLEDEARKALEKGIAESSQPYYFMSDMGYLEKQAGNDKAAIHWYRKAWANAEGQATRIQWGTEYILALIELRPDNTNEIATSGVKVLSELAAQKDGLHQRNSGRMDQLSDKLLSWSGSSENASQPAQDRLTALSEMRAAMNEICAGSEARGEAGGTCDTFLVSSTARVANG
jgi:thioredoxin-related protein